MLTLAADVLVSSVSTVEQQSHHDVVAQAVLQRRGEQRVADHSEVTVHVCAVGQQQPHEVVPANGTRRHTGLRTRHCSLKRSAPLRSYGDQDASQGVQVGPRSSRQQHLSTGHVTIGNSKVQRSFPEVAIVLCPENHSKQSLHNFLFHQIKPQCAVTFETKVQRSLHKKKRGIFVGQ